MNQNYKNYKVNNAKDIKISTFFEEFPFSEWNVNSYYNYLLRDKKVKRATAKNAFIDDIKKLLASKAAPALVNTNLGHLVQDTAAATKTKETNTIINNTGVFVSSNSNSTINVNCHSQPEPIKKRKMDDECWTISSNEEFWESWKEYMEECQCHDFCLEHYHIIECGYTIKCKPNYNEDLYDQLGDNTRQTGKSPFKKHNSYSLKLLQSLQEGKERAISKALICDDHWKLIDQNDMTAKYVYDYFNLMYMYLHNQPALHQSESMFNHQIVWPIIQLAVKTGATTSTTPLTFFPGELLLDSSDENYKADSVIKFSDSEILLLETSGSYGLNEKPRFGFDHIKGSFGALTFLRNILRKYCFAKFETAKELEILFIHARGKHMHFWSLCLTSPSVRVLEHIAFTRIPLTGSEGTEILDLGVFAWTLKSKIVKTCFTIDKMKAEHEQFSMMQQLGSTGEKRLNLAELAEEEMQKPVRGGKYGVLLPEQLDECEHHRELIEEV
ncbi:hypothetical protein BD560DRAFT_391506 [Blakeslea trispora]|nr:hypothetical protein BD560DRAFT_391506 [Blakeslea trispora]